MIGIRECITENELKVLLNEHKAFVGSEVEKRIDFYINLFETLMYFQTNPRTHAATIENRIKSASLHHNQYLSFIGYITQKPKEFDNAKYKQLKNVSFFKIDMRNFKQISDLLKELKRRFKSIIALDLSRGRWAERRFYAKIKVNFSPLGILLDKIFDYDWFLNQSPEAKWGAYQLTKGLKMKVCPYCNRQYTFTLSKGRKKVTKPELDHFLPQKENSLLRISFFNLIPSCTICNRDCKGQISFNYEDYLSPYEDNKLHSLMSYDYIPTSYSGAIGESEDIRLFIKTDGVKLAPDLLKKVHGNIDTFEYTTIVNEHKDVVREIIRKRVISNDSYLKMIIDLFPSASLTPDEAYRLAYGNFYAEKQFNSRPLAKLTKDIAIGVGALKIHKR